MSTQPADTNRATRDDCAAQLRAVSVELDGAANFLGHESYAHSYRCRDVAWVVKRSIGKLLDITAALAVWADGEE